MYGYVISRYKVEFIILLGFLGCETDHILFFCLLEYRNSHKVKNERGWSQNTVGGMQLPFRMLLVVTLPQTLKLSGRGRKKKVSLLFLRSFSVSTCYFLVWNKAMITTITWVSQAKEDTQYISYILKCTFPPHILTSLKLGNTLFYNKLTMPFLLTRT